MSLSVIIPTYNRAMTLRKCLTALQRQTCGADRFEVIVADDGSSDDTRAAAEETDVRYLYQPNSGANAARNRAIAVARGDVLLFINDDIVAAESILAEHLAAHEKFPDDRIAVLGRVTVAPAHSTSRLAPLHLDRAFVGLKDGAELDWHAFFTCNVSVKKSLLLRCGLFEERIRYHEDLELAQRLSCHGLRVIYRAAALGYHDHLLTEEEFLSIAAREAKALVTWARLAPHLQPMLGELGFEPALPRSRRLRHWVASLVITRRTVEGWKAIARSCPRSLDPISRAIYFQIYQSVKRWQIQAEWTASDDAASASGFGHDALLPAQ